MHLSLCRFLFSLLRLNVTINDNFVGSLCAVSHMLIFISEITHTFKELATEVCSFLSVAEISC